MVGLEWMGIDEACDLLRVGDDNADIIEAHAEVIPYYVEITTGYPATLAMGDGCAETVKAPLPVLLTVNGSAAPCRPRNAKLVMARKRAEVPAWSVADVGADPAQCGLSGSPTKVKKVDSISFQAKESKRYSASDEDVRSLVEELITNHTIG